MVVPFGHFRHLDTKRFGTPQKQRAIPLFPPRRTAGGPGFPPRARCRRLIISYKNSKNSKQREILPRRSFCASCECLEVLDRLLSRQGGRQRGFQAHQGAATSAATVPRAGGRFRDPLGRARSRGKPPDRKLPAPLRR